MSCVNNAACAKLSLTIAPGNRPCPSHPNSSHRGTSHSTGGVASQAFRAVTMLVNDLLGNTVTYTISTGHMAVRAPAGPPGCGGDTLPSSTECSLQPRVRRREAAPALKAN